MSRRSGVVLSSPPERKAKVGLEFSGKKRQHCSSNSAREESILRTHALKLCYVLLGVSGRPVVLCVFRRWGERKGLLLKAKLEKVALEWKTPRL